MDYIYAPLPLPHLLSLPLFLSHTTTLFIPVSRPGWLSFRFSELLLPSTNRHTLISGDGGKYNLQLFPYTDLPA